MAQHKPDKISVAAEFENYGIAYKYESSSHIKCLCPFHADHSPSLHVSLDTGHFKCFVPGCETSGDIITLLARYAKCSRTTVFADLQTRYNFDAPRIVDPQQVERCHVAIWSAPPLLAALYARGLTDEDIRRWRLGEHEGRITIPIKNDTGLYVNIRKYLPGAPGAQKMRSIRGHGSPRWYPVEQLAYGNLLLCGGEIKALAAIAQLNKHNWGAACITAGEGKATDELISRLSGKYVVNCTDIDDAGRNAAEIIQSRIHRVTSFCGDLFLPLDRDKYPKGDINDYIGGEHGDLWPLLADIPKYQPRVAVKSQLQDYNNIEPEQCKLSDAIGAERTGKRVQFKASVTAAHETSYVVPRKVKAVCDKSAKCCAICPVYVHNTTELEVHAESSVILEIANAPTHIQREALMRSLGIPLACGVVTFESSGYYTVDELRVSPQLDIANRARENIMQPCMVVNTNGKVAELNESYRMTGRMFPHPRNQQATLLVSDYTPTQDALATYECGDLAKLEMFRPKMWSVDAIQNILDDIYSDIEANVTRVFQRRDIHFTADLAYHSPLYFRFDGRQVKGWVEVLILGDSSQGKSEAVCGSQGPGGLMQHYGLGVKAECKNASVAGLLGGLQKLDGRWFVTWGTIPTNDKRLVILEELKGASTEVISALTDQRSSGIAQIEKIQRRRTQARVRLIAISNPRSDLPMANHNFGTEAIRELIGALEDIRRFDVCLLVASSEIDAALLNTLQRNRPTVEHVFTGDLCRELILWGWTRTGEQVIFTDTATQAALDHATCLSEEFTDQIPILDRGSTRYKLARLAASLAVRTFSTTADYQSIVVEKAHVDYIAAFLRRIYSSPVSGYADYTAAVRITQELTDIPGIKALINGTPFAVDFCKSLLRSQKLDVYDLMDFTGWERAESAQLLSSLVRKHALVRDSRSYRKSPQFIALLKYLTDTPGELVNRPEFVKEQF